MNIKSFLFIFDDIYFLYFIISFQDEILINAMNNLD